MPLFMDRHEAPGITPAQVAAAHASDVAQEQEYGVKFISYWMDHDNAAVFCLADAPSKQRISDLHEASHGMIPNEIIPVQENDVLRFLGRVHEPLSADEIDNPFRVITFTDIVDSTAMAREMGDARYLVLLTEHDLIVRRAVVAFQGREVKHTGDGFLLVFNDVSAALACTARIQGDLAAWRSETGVALHVRIGITAGEPVDHNDDLYGTAVNLAARLCAEADPDRVLCAGNVRDLGASAGFGFEPAGERTVKGFDEPVPVFHLVSKPA